LTLRYTIQPENPGAHLYRITLAVPGPVKETVELRLPDWIPGSYMIRDFARNIVDISASQGDATVDLVKTGKSSWQISPAAIPEAASCAQDSTKAPLLITYQVYAWELSVRAAHLDTLHGFFNGTSVFLFVVGKENEACEMLLQAPADVAMAGWQVATAMPALEIDKNGFGLYRAKDYDELIDHPVEMGKFERLDFTACGIPHQVILTGRHRADAVAITDDLTRICETQIRFFGEPPPMKQFLFMVMVVGKGYGGLEHRESTALMASREGLPLPGTHQQALPREESSYIDFLGLCSHEYFHCWNVKRIKPAVFIPYELNQETHTELLWAFEGITSYYDDLFLVRSGVISQKRYLKLLGKTITRVRKGSGRLKQSVAESSFDAWTRFYKQDENAPNAIVSYYAKGALVAFCLDMLIRERSGGRHSLDDLMKTLWSRWQQNGEGVVQQDFQDITAELAGERCDDFFQQAVFGRSDLDLDAACDTAGIELNWRQRRSIDDTGGEPETAKPDDGNAQEMQSIEFGMATSPCPEGLKVTQVHDGSAAQQAGLAAGDVIVAIDRLSVSGSNLEKFLKRYQAGDEIITHAFRHGELHELTLTCQPSPETACWLEAKEAGLLEGWLDEAPA